MTNFDIFLIKQKEIKDILTDSCKNQVHDSTRSPDTQIKRIFYESNDQFVIIRALIADYQVIRLTYCIFLRVASKEWRSFNEEVHSFNNPDIPRRCILPGKPPGIYQEFL